MAQWTIQTTDDAYSITVDNTRVLSADGQGVTTAYIGAQTGEVQALTAWAIRNNELTLQASSPPDPPGEGDVKLFLDGTTGHLALMTPDGTIYPFDPRLFAAAPVAVKPAPPALDSAR